MNERDGAMQRARTRPVGGSHEAPAARVAAPVSRRTAGTVADAGGLPTGGPVADVGGVAMPADDGLRGGTQAPESQKATLYDPRDPATRELLLRRTSGGGYAVHDIGLVLAIRAWSAQDGEGRPQARSIVRELCGLLIQRCLPEFQRRAWGLRHRPTLMEDAIAGMVEQVLREVQDPNEVFLTKNFIHYLHCVGADNFNRVLRQEGLSYRRDEQGRPAGRPQHVPAALVDRIDVPAPGDAEEGTGTGRDIPMQRDDLDERMAAVEAQRILAYLDDPLDRKILVLRIFEQMRWDDIAALCGKTERTMRLRYEKARATLRERIRAERVAAGEPIDDEADEGAAVAP